MRRDTALMLVLLLLGFGCSTERDPRDLLAPGQVGVIVVDAQLVVGKSMPRIRLAETQAPDQPYVRGMAGLDGASVEVRSSEGDVIRYGPTSAEPGMYGATDAPSGYLVRPHTTYALRVEAADGRVVTAETTTPDLFTVRDWLLLDDTGLTVRRRLATRADFGGDGDSVYLAASNQLVYQDGLVEARFDGGGAQGYQIGLVSLDAGSPIVIEADFLGPEELARLERETSWPPVDATDASMRLPWYSVFFEGRYDIKIFSLDRNWYDLSRSLQSFGGSTIGFGSTAGDDFERPIFHVNGGIGLFGSASMDETGVTIHPRP